MFVSIACDVANEDHRLAVQRLLAQYGFKKIQRDLYEHTSIAEAVLARLKRDVDKATDFYDSVRFYQFPIDETLVITSLKEKRWRKLMVQSKP